MILSRDQPDACAPINQYIYAGIDIALDPSIPLRF